MHDLTPMQQATASIRAERLAAKRAQQKLRRIWILTTLCAALTLIAVSGVPVYG